MRLFSWFRKQKLAKQSHTRAKATKKTFKLIGLDICFLGVRCRECGGRVRLTQDGIDRLETACPGCGQQSRLVVMPFEQSEI